MICITGAGGTVGSELVSQLTNANVPFRAAFHSKEKADAASAKGINSVIIDYNNLQSLHLAFEECDKVYLLGPNLPNQIKMELNIVDAAKKAGVRHIIKQSVLGAEEESFILGKIHRTVEKAIESSGLAWTHLRPNSFMQNSVTFMAPTITAVSAFYSASEQARISHVDIRDIAAVAVQTLTESQHEGNSYTLTGPEAVTYDELASELSNSLGRAIKHISLPPAELKGAMLGVGVPEEIADRLLDLERYFRKGGASRITNDIKQVIGQEPRRLADYIKKTTGTGVWDSN